MTQVAKRLVMRAGVASAVWTHVSQHELSELTSVFSRIERQRGRLPSLVYAMRNDDGLITRIAMRYDGNPHTYGRWGFQNRPVTDLTESWSTIRQWLTELEGDRAFVEAYPDSTEVVATAATRWFWLLPWAVPPEFNLLTIQRLAAKEP